MIRVPTAKLALQQRATWDAVRRNRRATDARRDLDRDIVEYQTSDRRDRLGTWSVEDGFVPVDEVFDCYLLATRDTSPRGIARLVLDDAERFIR